MADDTVALQARGYDPNDFIAPLQAYSQMMAGQNLGAEAQSRQIANQQNQLGLLARQSYVSDLQRGMDPGAASVASGLPVDPAAEAQSLTNAQSRNTLGALKSYSQNPSNLSPLGMISPEAVSQGATALGTQATTAGVNQDTEEKKANLRGQIALGYEKNPTEQGWQTAVAQARQAGLITDLHVYSALNHMTDPKQRMGIAKMWIASGAGSVQSSGMATANNLREAFPYNHFAAGPTDQVFMGGAWKYGPPPPSGYADPAPTSGGAPLRQGRSVGLDSAPGASPAGGPSPGQGTPLMAQLENAYRLPTGYLGGTARVESGGRADASNPSGAAGMFQFMPGTYARYGRPGTSPFDPVASTEAAARLAADNQAQMARALGRPPTAAELYLAHQQGPAGAIGLLSNPNASAASIVGAKAVISNGGTPNMTAGQFASMWQQKFNAGGNVNGFGFSGPTPFSPSMQMPTAPSTPAQSPAALPAAGMAGLRAAAAARPGAPDIAPLVGPAPAAASPSPAPAPSSAPMLEGRSASTSAESDLPQTEALNRSYQPFVAQRGMTPFQLEKQRLDAARAVSEETDARNQFVAAGDAQRNLLQLQDDLSKFTPKPGDTLRDSLLSNGSGADFRIGLAKTINSVLATGGFQPLFDPEKITAAESANKVTGRLGFDLAGGLGKGQAGYIINEAVGLNPSVLNTPGGQKLLIGSLLAAQQRQRDLYLYQRDFASKNGGNPIGAEVPFDRDHPPMRYVEDAQRLARVPSPAVKFLQDHDNQQTVSAFEGKYGSGLARYFLGSGAQ